MINFKKIREKTLCGDVVDIDYNMHTINKK